MTKHLFLVMSIAGMVACTGNVSKDTTSQNTTNEQVFTSMDINKDGHLSPTEATGKVAKDFDEIDTNKDGKISQVELGKMATAQRPKKPSQAETVQDLSTFIDLNAEVVPVNTDHFIAENLIDGISTQTIDLSGVSVSCYVLKSKSQATEHQMGPWCPRHIDDGIEKAGIWFENDKVYDVSGHFIANLDDFYDDNKWRLYKDDGTVKVTDSKESCLAAAKPNVEEAYHNHCVECLPQYFDEQVTTFVIPATPVYLSQVQRLGRGGIGVAFNGVKYDPPAPTHAILAAHTIAPLDDHGGHVNPHGGYHYHAVTGSTKEVAQSDSHAPMIGYAIDGFGIYALTDKNGNEATGLDECGGHTDDIRGYHYHAGKPGDNQILKCLHGLPGYTEVAE